MPKNIVTIGGIAVYILLAIFILRPEDFVAYTVKVSEAILAVIHGKDSEDSTSEAWWELGKIDRDFYIVKKSDTGQEVRLTVTADTRVIGSIKVGQTIDASVLPNGRALAITSLAKR